MQYDIRAQERIQESSEGFLMWLLWRQREGLTHYTVGEEQWELVFTNKFRQLLTLSVVYIKKEHIRTLWSLHWMFPPEKKQLKQDKFFQTALLFVMPIRVKQLPLRMEKLVSTPNI